MPAVVLLLGSLLGFAAGVYAFVAAGAGLFTAIAIWAVSGPLSIVLLASLHALRQPQPQTRPEHRTRPEIA